MSLVDFDGFCGSGPAGGGTLFASEAPFGEGEI